MKMHLDCANCFLNQAIRTGRLLGCSDRCLWQMVKGCGQVLSQVNEDLPPPQNAVALYDMIAEKAGIRDPFYKLKKESTRHALGLYPELKRKIKDHMDALEAALRFAACGNVIDYGVSSDFNLLKEVEKALGTRFSVWEYNAFLKRLSKAGWILYLGDNCGETVFDRLLIEELKKPVKYAVRGGPIINDVTEEDARDAGLHEVAEIVSTGYRAPGIVLKECSDSFRELFASAPMIISKGQGNFETLSDENREIFFIFKIKCNVVSSFLDLPLNTMFLGRTKAQAG